MPFTKREMHPLLLRPLATQLATALGSGLILMRLSDALAELGADAGLQVHRSWRVAQDAVREVRRDGARVLLELRNGLEVPVSRTYLAAVRAAGWPMPGAAPPGSVESSV